MNSPLAKVLHPLAGRPLVHHVVASARRAGAGPIAIVVGHQAQTVRESFCGDEVDLVFVHQAKRLGTGHAASIGLSALGNQSGDVLLLCGDVPLLRPETIGKLIQQHRSAAAAVTVLTAILKEPSGYGRVLRETGPGGRVVAIVEDADATETERAIPEINSGTYIFALDFLARAIPRLQAENRQGEYYLTDVVAMAAAENRPVEAFPAPIPEEVSGINNPADLARAEAFFAAREEKGP
jgi:bifunctional UDP-N-acetylglucosamine pyrophosphorylase/glucosamine-1-phosphate N-acetyltransferase